jgi:hypothetical protein
MWVVAVAEEANGGGQIAWLQAVKQCQGIHDLAVAQREVPAGPLELGDQEGQIESARGMRTATLAVATVRGG